MKVCPKCNQQYNDQNLNFCLSDGELLMETDSADATPTVYLDAPRVTNQDWEVPDAPPTMPQYENQAMYQQPFASPQAYPALMTKDKSLATVALVLGILSLVLFCCYLGLPLGAAGFITGYLGMKRVSDDSSMYGGKEMAMVGMILGGISVALTVVFFVLWMIGMIFS